MKKKTSYKFIISVKDTVEIKITTKEGQERLCEMGMRPIMANDNIGGVQYIVRDITERRKAEEALKASQLKLWKQKINLEEKNIALKEILEQI